MDTMPSILTPTINHNEERKRMIDALTECVHGLLWKTCNLCVNKTESELKDELYPEQESKTVVKYDYQEIVQSDEVEADLAYDIEDSEY